MQDFSNGDSGEIALKYLKQLGFQPTVVFDIGANTGESAKLLTSLWSNDASRPFTLHSFEPVPREYYGILPASCLDTTPHSAIYLTDPPAHAFASNRNVVNLPQLPLRLLA